MRFRRENSNGADYSVKKHVYTLLIGCQNCNETKKLNNSVPSME